MTLKQIGIAGLSLAVGAAFMMGCQAPNEAQANPIAPINNDAMIQQIQNDPNMPADQKAAALGRLKAKAPVPSMYAH